MTRPIAFVPVAALPFALTILIIAFVAVCRPVAAEEIDDSNVRLKQVVAYTSGVAFFERAGEVEGDADVVLRFPEDSMNDLLKSLVLLDLDGGKTATVTYENRHELARTAGALSLELSSTSSLADVLRQFSGQRIVSGKIRGRLVSVESESRGGANGVPVQNHSVLVQTEEGLLRMPLAGLPMIKLEDKEAQSQFDEAVAQLATASDVPTKQVTLQFRGEGKRRVRIGYLQEFPMWKVSYRLVMDDDEEMLLQGWGLVENTTGDDWKDVELSLVSGQPFAFRMNLYEPLYVARPEAPVSVAAGILPRAYAGQASPSRGQAGGVGGGAMGGGGGMFGGAGVGGDFGTPVRGQDGSLGDRLNESQIAMANAQEVGELFHYTIDRPVSLASDTSAMLPIVNAKIEGEKVSLYDPAVNDMHPMHAVRLTNSTKLHLMRGPVAVLDDGGYAGDARLTDTPPDAERLITYAMDSEIEVVIETGPTREELVNVTLKDRALITRYRSTRSIDYRLTNESNEPRTVIVQRLLQSWKVTQPDVVKTTDNTSRFEVEVPAGETVTVTLVENREREDSAPVEQLADDDLKMFIDSPMTDAASKEALSRLYGRRQEVLQLRMTINVLEAELRTLVEDQTRIGKSLQQLERGSALYNRYIEKLDQQETQIEERRKRLETIKGEHAQLLEERGAEDPFGF